MLMMRKKALEFLLLTYILGMCYPNSAFSCCKVTAVKNATLVPSPKITLGMSKQGDTIRRITKAQYL